MNLTDDSFDESNLKNLRDWIAASADVVQAMNGDAPVGALLNNIAAQACRLLDLNMCSMLLANEEGTQLLALGSHGLSDTYITRLNNDHPLLLPAHAHVVDAAAPSPSVKAFLTGSTVVVPSIKESLEFAPWRDMANEEGYGALIATPLKHHNMVTGVLVGYSRQETAFTDEQQVMMRLLADFAGITLLTATLRAAGQSMIAELNKANQSLRDQRDTLDRVESQHEQLMRAVASDIGVDGVISMMANMLKVSITLQGNNGSIISQERLDLTDELFQVLMELLHSHVQKQPQQVLNCEAIATDDQHSIFHVPVYVGEKTVASLWVGPVKSTDSHLEHQVLERFALVVALELAKQRSAMLAQLSVSRDLLSELLTGSDAHSRSVLFERARAMGHDLERDQLLGVIRTPGSSTDSTKNYARHRPLVEIAGNIARAEDFAALVGGSEDELVVLLATDDASRDATDTRSLENFLRLVIKESSRKETSTPLAAVIAKSQGGVTRVSWDYRACVGALRLLPANAHGQVVLLSDLGISALLLTHGSPEDLVHFAESTLSPILNRDAAKTGDLLLTLRVWLTTSCSTSGAAKLLNVHPNTVVYRLRAIEEMLQGSLKDPDLLLKVDMAMRIHEIHGTPSP